MIHCEKCGKQKIEYAVKHSVCGRCEGPLKINLSGDYLWCDRCDRSINSDICNGRCKKSGCFKTTFKIILGGIIGGVVFNYFTNSTILILIGMVMGYVGIEMLIWWKSKPNTFTDPRDGKEYKYVKIGKQVWMAENLDYNEEDSILSDCYEYGGYGRLYRFETAKKACPPGWHLPSKEELEILLNFVGGKDIAGKKLKAKSDWDFCHIDKKFGNGTDNYGFSALPSYISGCMGCWWSASEWFGDQSEAFYLEMNHTDDGTILTMKNKYKKFAVRCLWDGQEPIKKKLPNWAIFSIVLGLCIAIALFIFSSNKNSKPIVETETPNNNSKPIVEGDILTDSRDSKTYRTIKIGNQTWMAENLNYEIEDSKCYDNNFANCQKYGRLYQWKPALKACPSGWHLPKDYEWEALANYIGSDAGRKLKAKSGWDSNGTDEYGFSALPSGTGKSDGTFIMLGSYGYWWSAGEGTDAYYRYISSENNNLNKLSSTKKGLFPIRCLRD